MPDLNSGIYDDLDLSVNPAALLSTPPVRVVVPSRSAVVPAFESTVLQQSAALQQHRAAYSDQKEIYFDLSSRKSISVSDAETIETVYGQFIGPAVALAEFSQTPSRTRYAFTLQHLKQRLALEEHALLEETLAYKAAVIAQSTACCTYLLKIQHAPLVEWLKIAQKTHQACLTQLVDSPNLCILLQKSFVTLPTTPLQFFANQTFSSDDALAALVLKALANAVLETGFLQWIDWALAMHTHPPGHRAFLYTLGAITGDATRDTLAACLKAVVGHGDAATPSPYACLLSVLREEVLYLQNDLTGVINRLDETSELSDKLFQALDAVFTKLGYLSTVLRQLSCVNIAIDETRNALTPLL